MSEMSTTTITAASLPAEIPGVDQLSRPERRARAIAGPFYSDQFELLEQSARRARDRARPGRIFIAPECPGFTIYRRTVKA